MNVTSDKKTILLLGNYRPTLTLARVLARHGYRIISGLEGCDRGAEYSRYVNQIWDHPPIKTNPEGFQKSLARFIRENSVDVIFPVSEEFVRFFADHPNLECGNAAIASVDANLIKRCLDKMFMMELAQKHKIPTADFAFAANQRELVEKSQAIGFPLVIRPQESNQRLGGKKALFIDDEPDLQQQLPKWPDLQKGLIIQKKARGKRHNIYFAARNGKLYRYLHAVILRTDMEDGSGLAVEGVTIAPDPQLQRFTATLVESLNYSGIGCAQYLVDDETGDISFLEINPRIAGNHAVPEFAGLELSSILVDMALNQPLNTRFVQGRTDIRYVWTYGDFLSAKSAWLRREITSLATVARFWRAARAGIRAHLHMSYVWHDPRPGIMSLLSLAPNWRRLFARLANSERRPIRAQARPPH